MIKSKIEMGSPLQNEDSPKMQARLTFNDGLWQLLARTDHIITKLRQKELRQHGINMNEAIVLFTVVRLKRLATQANISQQLFWELHTVSEQLKSMETKGLIKRTKDPKRRNLLLFEATDKGLEAYRKSTRRKSTRQIMSALTKDEQLQMWGLLVKIRERAMGEAGLCVPNPFPPSDPKELH